MYVSRTPGSPLRRHVRVLWTVDEAALATQTQDCQREAVLPSGLGHIAIRLTGRPFEFGGDNNPVSLGPMVACGPRSRPYLRRRGETAISVGAQLQPGAALTLFGLPVDLIREQHVALDDLWGPFALTLREQLGNASCADDRLDIFEKMLEERLKRHHGLHPAVAYALQELAKDDDIGAIVDETGYSHRHFNALFRQTTGFTPKKYGRLQRFCRSLDIMAKGATTSTADVALAAGYSDQAHFNRDFKEFAHMTPGGYLNSPVKSVFHVPLTDDLK